MTSTTSRRRTAATLAAAVATTLAATARAAPPGAGWDLTFADEFVGPSLDAMKWVPQYPWSTTHNHQANSSPNALSFDGNDLTITATNTPSGGKPFTSGTISTGYDLFKYTRGYAEARIKLPSQPGSWPAFWMLDAGWPPEIDVMEFPVRDAGSLTRYKTNYHYSVNGTNGSIGTGPNHGGVDLSATYNTYGVEWTTDTLRFYFNGNAVRTFTNAAAVADMSSAYLILNYAVGDTDEWGGELPANLSGWQNTGNQMKVDWVRVWQQRPAGATSTSTWNVNGNGSWDNGGAWTGIVPKFGGQDARFGRVGAAATAAVTWANSRTVGSLTFEGDATGTTAYTLGSDAGSLQMAGAGAAANAAIRALATSTATQTINSRLELFNTTDVSNAMTGGQAVVLNGVIFGPGGLTIDGPGAVQISNNNTYTGDTTIDPGTQGAAVARVTRSRAFGTGAVHLGPGGNATTARIEIRDNRDLPNTVNFYGRGNTSVGIQNLAGNNSFSGTIQAQVGGSNYVIQSDAGLLTLSGAAPAAAGVALSSVATGNRTFTLQGSGNGAVSGAIRNGSATSVSIVKAGAGTWTAAAANNYTGTTTITGGTLLVTNTHTGGGTYAVSPGATLGGTGTIDPAAAAAVAVSGRLAPGNGVGKLTVGSLGSANDVVVGNGGALEIEVAAAASDLLAVAGLLDLSAADDELRLVTASGGFALSSYTLATFTTAAGAGNTFGKVFLDNVLQAAPEQGMTNGYRLAYDPGQVRLVAVVPEPAGFGVLACAAGALARRRSRR